MPEGDLAERILCLSVSRERAASIVGDFLEEDCGAFRFWVQVARTMLAQASGQAAAPWRCPPVKYRRFTGGMVAMGR